MATYVELPTPADLIADRAGNIQRGAAATVYLRDTLTDATHSATDGAGSSTATGGLIVRGDGSIGTATERRYFQHGVPVDVTVAGRTRGVEPWSAAAVESGGVSPAELAAVQAEVDTVTPLASLTNITRVAVAPTGTDTVGIQALLTAAAASGATEASLRTGSYSFTNLTFPVTAFGTVKLVGQGIGKTTLTCTGTTGYAIMFGDGGATNDQRAYVADLTLVGNVNMDGAVRLNHTRFTGLDRVKIQDFTKAGAAGLSTGSGGAAGHNYFCRLQHCQFTNIPTGVSLATSGGIGGNSTYIEYCHFGVHSSQAVLLDAVTGAVVTGNEFTNSTTGVRIQGAARHNKIAFNQFDGPSLTVDIDAATVLDTNLIGNTGMGTVTTGGVALTGAQYLSSRTVRVDSESLSLPNIINGGIEVGNYTQTNPVDGVGALGAIRSNLDLRAHHADTAKEIRLLDGYVLTPALAATPAIPRAFYTDANGRLVWVNASNQAMQVQSYGYLGRTSDFTIDASREYDIIAYTALAAPRTVTMPSAAAVGVKGRVYTIKDEAGGAAAQNLTIARAGSDTFEGGGTSIVLSTNFAVQRLYSDGVSKWFKC